MTRPMISLPLISKEYSNGYPCPRILVACRISANGGQPYYAKAAYWANEVKKSNKHKMNPDIYAIWKNMAADKYDTEYNESIWEAEFIGNRTADGMETIQMGV